MLFKIKELPDRLFFQRKYRLYFSFFLFLILFSIFIFKINLSNRIDVQFGSDEWDYQSIAVNFAKGHGFHVAGGFEDADVYKFEKLDPGIYDKLEVFKGIPNLHRPPLYPFLIGLIYKLFGINPLIIVVLQLIMLCVTASALPLIGYFLWRKEGFWIGLLSAFIFMAKSYHLANIFLPGQTTIIFFVFIFIFSTEWYFKKPTIRGAAVSALILSISLLFHATMILVPLFMFFYFLWLIKKVGFRSALKNFVVFVSTIILVLLPWHIYAFKTLQVLKKDASIIISAITDASLSEDEKLLTIDTNISPYSLYLKPQTAFTNSEIEIIKDSLLVDVKNNGLNIEDFNESQIDYIKLGFLQEIIDAPPVFLIFLSPIKNIALDAHNEFVSHGWASKEWRYNAESHYRNDKLDGKISFLRVYKFYKENPKMICVLLIRKIEFALKENIFIRLFLLSFIILFLTQRLSLYTHLKWLIVSLAVTLLIISVYFFETSYLSCSLFMIYVSFLLLSFLIKKDVLIPISFHFVFNNLVIFTVLAYSVSRYFEVLNTMYILLSLYLSYKTIRMFISYKQPL